MRRLPEATFVYLAKGLLLLLSSILFTNSRIVSFEFKPKTSEKWYKNWWCCVINFKCSKTIKVRAFQFQSYLSFVKVKIDDSAIFDWVPSKAPWGSFRGSSRVCWKVGFPMGCYLLLSRLKTSLYCRRVNVSHFGDPSQCWNELLTQRTYVILLQPHYGHHQLLHDALFKARYDDPLGAAIEFTTETERKLQKALGNNFPLLLQQNYNIDFRVLLLSEFR